VVKIVEPILISGSWTVARAVLPQPLVQKSFYNLQNSFFPTKFPCQWWKKSRKFRQFEANVNRVFYCLKFWASFQEFPP
jgi:hypothetical protein